MSSLQPQFNNIENREFEPKIDKRVSLKFQKMVKGAVRNEKDEIHQNDNQILNQ